MSGNPKTSKYYSTPRAERKSRAIELTLSPAARARLESLHSATGESKSAIVDALLMSEFAEENSVKKLFSTIVK